MEDEIIDLEFGIFWDEFKSIEESSVQLSEDDVLKEGTDIDAEWLSDAGFPSFIDKFRDNKEINLHDQDLIAITESLTHSQAAAVRKRIESLNETIRKKRQSQIASSKHADVRNLFPAQTEAEPTDRNSESTNQARSQPIYDPLKNSVDYSKPVKRADTIEQDTFYFGTPSGKLRSARAAEPIFFGTNTTETPLQLQRTATVETTKQPKIVKSTSTQFWKGITPPPPPRRSVSEGVQLLMVRKRNEDEQQWNRSQLNDALLSPLANQKLGYAKTQIGSFDKKEPIDYSRRQSIPILSEKRTEGMLSSPSATHRRHSSNALPSSYSQDLPENNNKHTVSNGLHDEVLEDVKDVKSSTDAKLNIGSSNCKLSIFGNDSSFPPLPNFTLTREDLGMTRVKDLSEADMLKVRSLALIELTALLDSYNIPMNRRKGIPKVKQKDTGVFGVPLNILAQKDEKAKDPECKAPNFAQEIFSYLEVNGLKEEGLLRVTGSAQRIKLIREEIEDRYCDAGFFSWNGRRATDVANLLKQFLRELPTPLVTREYQNTFASVANLPERKLQLQALNLLMLLLPPVHRDTLKLLLEFLNKVISNEHYNKMGLNNVAMIMAPNLFFNSSTKADMESVTKAATFTDIMRMLIKYQNILWTVPGFMVTQIRYLYEAGTKTRDPKARPMMEIYGFLTPSLTWIIQQNMVWAILKTLYACKFAPTRFFVRKVIAKRMRDSSSGPFNTRGKSFSSGDEVDGPEIGEGCIIRIKAPMMEKTCMAMHVYENTTVADLIAKFRWRRNSSRRNSNDDYLTPGHKNSMSKSDTSLDRDNSKQFFLYEVGGNIGERRLDPHTNMLALIRVNPNAEWILRG